MEPHAPLYLPRAELDALFGALRKRGYHTVGPTRRNGAIVLDRVEGTGDLPVGWVDDQEAGSYAIRHADNGRVFDFTVGHQSWRSFLRPPHEPMWSAKRNGADVAFEAAPQPTERYALIGVRSCDIAALGVLDGVLTQQAHRDGRYGTRRANAFIVAVQCARAGATCFCVSMNTGPRSDAGFDLALTELDEGFVVEIGSEAGADVVADLPAAPATDAHRADSRAVTEATARSMGRELDTEGLREALLDRLEHPHWNDVASRCLACANCTMVCPTCFCTTTTIDTDLTGTTATQAQVWDSCFHTDFTSMHGGAVRSTTASRYRQWLTHKLATWHDQFGESGCVGCGRCITWCPVGIDLTAEVARLRATETS